jgi:hypothetical protein
LQFYAPIIEAGSDETPTDVTKKVFQWIENRVVESPETWWCWEIFDELMRLRK